MIVQVCRADGVVIGKFEQADFQEKMRRGELPAASGQYSYWHEGMAEWKPLSEYRPPGKITNILDNIPTREQKRQQVHALTASKSGSPRPSVLKKFTRAFRSKKTDS